MSNRSLKLVLGFAVAAVVGMVAAQRAAAAGYWNVPGTFCQCFGYGYGPGYHAPLVLGPMSCDGWLAIDVKRLPYSPTSQHRTHTYQQGVHCVDPSPLFQPSVLSPATSAAAPVPAGFRGPVLR